MDAVTHVEKHIHFVHVFALNTISFRSIFLYWLACVKMVGYGYGV